jgi:hypothetical protein
VTVVIEGFSFISFSPQRDGEPAKGAIYAYFCGFFIEIKMRKIISSRGGNRRIISSFYFKTPPGG